MRSRGGKGAGGLSPCHRKKPKDFPPNATWTKLKKESGERKSIFGAKKSRGDPQAPTRRGLPIAKTLGIAVFGKKSNLLLGTNLTGKK